MQKTLVIFSRFFFVGTILLLILTLFIGGLLSFNHTVNEEKASRGEIGKAGVILASQRDLLSDSDEMVDDDVVVADARPLLIKGYLEKYKSPLAPYSDLILKLSETYKFDYYWILAIGQQESNLCKKIPENSYNCWGYGINSAGTLRFENYELALKSFAEYLKREYFDKGYNTPELIMKKYCPHSNGSWAYGVNHFIEEIENGKF
jgi:hypothetical protein